MGEMDCRDHDCLKDLASQLAIFILIRLTLANFMEIGLPYVKMWWRGYKEGRQFQQHPIFTSEAVVHMPDLSPCERQAKMEKYIEFEDMEEVLITFGYGTLFVVACPWVPFVILFGNILEASWTTPH